MAKKETAPEKSPENAGSTPAFPTTHNEGTTRRKAAMNPIKAKCTLVEVGQCGRGAFSALALRNSNKQMVGSNLRSSHN